MTGRERLLATIRGEPVDRVPVYHLQFSGHAASVILGRDDVCIGGEHNQWLEINALWEGEQAHSEFESRCEEDAVAVARACGHDLLRLTYWRWPKDEKPVKKIDDFTFLFGDPDGHWYSLTYNPDIELMSRTEGYKSQSRSTPRRPAEPEATEEEFRREVEEEERTAQEYSSSDDPNPWLKQKIEKYPEYLIRHGGGTVFVDMYSPRELMAVALWPDLYSRKLMAKAERLAKDIPSLAASGLELNLSGMDFCHNQGPAISPETFREVVMPAMKLIVDACHEHGMYYFYTSDGNFWLVAEAMFEGAGVDGWCETDASAGMDLRRLRERFPKVVFQGTIRSQLLHRGTREEVIRETLSCLEVARDMGGVLVGVSNLIMPGTPAENIIALLETLEQSR